MAIGITVAQQAALADAQLVALAERVITLFVDNSVLELTANLDRQVLGWLREGRDGGVVTELDLARLCLVLADIDAHGRRPQTVAERLADRDVSGELKVFQVTHAWNEHLSSR
jgi:hypothetical protein